MARTRTVVTEELPEPSELELDQDATFAEILGELNAAPDDVLYTGTVHEVPVRPDGTAVKGSKEIFLFDVDQSQFAGLNEYLRDNVGTGTYRVRVKKNGILVKNTTLRVKKIGLPTIQAANENNQIVLMLQDVLKQQNERMAKLEDRLAQVPTTQISEMDRLEKLSTIMKNLREDRPVEAPRESMKDSFALMTTMFAFAEKVVGKGGGTETSWMDVLKSAIDNGAVQEIAKNGIQLGPKPAPPPQQIPSRPVPAQPQPAPVPENPLPDMIRIPIGDGKFLNVPAPIHARINETIITLCRRARTNANDAERSQPFGYVDFVLDELDDIDPTGGLQMQLVGNQNSLALLMEAFPATVPYKEWFAVLLDECKKAIAGDADVGGADCLAGQAAGNHAGNFEDHAPFDSAGEA